MNRCAVVIVCCAVIVSTPVFADSVSIKRQTTLNNVTDFLATIGKSGQDKKEVLQERREIRRDVRSKEEARRKRSATRKRMKQQEQQMMRKINGH